MPSHPAPVCSQNQISLLPVVFAGQLGLLLLLCDYLQRKTTPLQLAELEVHRKSNFRSNKGKRREFSLATQPEEGQNCLFLPLWIVWALRQFLVQDRIIYRRIRVWKVSEEAAQAPAKSEYLFERGEATMAKHVPRVTATPVRCGGWPPEKAGQPFIPALALLCTGFPPTDAGSSAGGCFGHTIPGPPEEQERGQTSALVPSPH